jgi:hypothetical protein
MSETICLLSLATENRWGVRVPLGHDRPMYSERGAVQ